MVKNNSVKTSIFSIMDWSEEISGRIWPRWESENEASEEYIPTSWSADEDLYPEQLGELVRNSKAVSALLLLKVVYSLNNIGGNMFCIILEPKVRGATYRWKNTINSIT